MDVYSALCAISHSKYFSLEITENYLARAASAQEENTECFQSSLTKIKVFH